MQTGVRITVQTLETPCHCSKPPAAALQNWPSVRWIRDLLLARERIKTPNDRSRRVPCVRFVRHNAANETIPCTLADESAAFDRLAQGSVALGAALSAEAAGSQSVSSDQATTRSACSTLPLVSGASTSERAKLSAPTQVPIIIGIA